MQVDLVRSGKSAGASTKNSIFPDHRWYLPLPDIRDGDLLTFYYPNTTPGDITYHGITIYCTDNELLLRTNDEEPGLFGPWTDINAYSEAHIVVPALQAQSTQTLNRYNDLVLFFTAAADEFKYYATAHGAWDENRIKTFLVNNFTQAIPLLKSAASQNDYNKLVAIYATSLAHFLVDLTRADGLSAKEVVLNGAGGTCWQQSFVAGFIAEQLSDKDMHLFTTDAIVMGHTVIGSDEFIMDATNNLVFFTDVDIWNQSAEHERLKILEDDTYYGVNRSFNRDLSANSYELFSREGNLDGFLELYKASLGLYPWTGFVSTER